MFFGQDWMAMLGYSDHSDSVIAQASLQSAESYLDRVLDQLALKIRNQIADMMKQS